MNCGGSCWKTRRRAASGLTPGGGGGTLTRMVEHRLGHLPDPPIHTQYTPVRRLIGAAPPPPSTCEDMIPLADVVLDQPGQTCVGHGLAGCAYVREASERVAQLMRLGSTAESAVMRALAAPRLFPSPTFIYSNACARGRYDGEFGVVPIDAITALADYGYCGIDAWGDDLDHLGFNRAGQPIARQPDADAYRLAADQRTIRTYRIMTDGTGAVDDVKRAIAAHYPVALALQVNDAYMTATDQVWRGIGPALGGHYVYAVAYTPDYLWTVGSYGRSFGMSGWVKVAWSAIGDPDVTSDRYAVTFAEPPTAQKDG